MPSSEDSSYCRNAQAIAARICLRYALHGFNEHPSVRGCYTVVSRLKLTFLGGTGILTCFPSVTPIGLTLGPD